MWFSKSIVLLGLAVLALGDYQYDTYYFPNEVDHFSFANSDYYMQRYLFNATWFKPGGPIFFYTGNEGDIEWFTQNAGFMWDIAPEFNALLVFAEHRYYGKSLPYGNESYSDINNLSYFSAEQTLADFAELINFIKETHNIEDSPVVVFGGSYGGMLAAWFRMKYPHVAAGAIAASAPILQFTGITDCEVFRQLVTSSFEREGKECSGSIRQSWAAIDSLTADDAGMQKVSSLFNLCDPLTTRDDVVQFKNILGGMYENAAMANYPYPAGFLSPLPAWPVKEMCKFLPDSTQDPQTLIEGLQKAVNLYFNYTGSTQCLATKQVDPEIEGDAGWAFQTCAEMVMPMCTNGVDDMFETSVWDLEAWIASCKQTYNVTTRPYQIELLFGGTDIDQYSNIVFSNGVLDPWSGGGVLANVSDTVVAILIEEGAHHLDLRASNPADPQSVIDARETEKAWIRRWIEKKE